MKKVLFAMIALVSCNEKSSIYYTEASKVGNVKKILVLGNSIVKHGPLPAIGWNNDWGMAASSIDSDFVHLLIRDLKKFDTSILLMYSNISDFERDYLTYDFKKADSFKLFNPDIIVMRIAENVNDAFAENNEFMKYYDKLINYIDSSGSCVKIICSGWWKNKNVNDLIYNYAIDKDYTFINQTELYSDSTIALGQYQNTGIQQHPNNLGMRKIEESIWRAIMPYVK